MPVSKNTLLKYKTIIDEYFVNGFNGSAAYQSAYNKVKDSTARTNFSKISNLPEVKRYIYEKEQKAAATIKVTHDGILKELKNYIQADLTEFIGLKPEEVKALPIEIKRLLSKFKETERQVHNSKGEVIETIKTIECSFVSKERALEMINKHIGFYSIDNAQKSAVINITASNEKHKNLIQGILASE